MSKNINQEKIINSNNNLLVIASAGCGKTYTIVNKISKLLLTIKPEEILVISFTNETVNDLLKKLSHKIHIKTFHKLAMMVLDNENYEYDLVGEELLYEVINKYFNEQITKKEKNKLKLYFFEPNYSTLLKSKSFKDFIHITTTFINLMKSNNYEFDFFKTIYKSEKDKFLLTIIMKIYASYKYEKDTIGLLDLDDIIVKAALVAKNTTFKYKYIFVDEFQDTSQIRFDLVYNIFKNSPSTINFFGDDFQSIYAFSGCNLNIMLDIKNKIPDIIHLELTQNYRSDNHLIQTSNNFVSKNPSQIKKSVISEIHTEKSINYIHYNNYYKSLYKLLNELKQIDSDIMLLGRYKSDFKNINFDCRKLTVHESKGLEARFVVILNLKNEKYGFPSRVKNHHLLNYFDNKYETFKDAEERRIFYVAITRAKEKVFLLVPKRNTSTFYKEFKKIDKKTN